MQKLTKQFSQEFDLLLDPRTITELEKSLAQNPTSEEFKKVTKEGSPNSGFWPNWADLWHAQALP